jgi:ribosome-interacting GTPase 1
MPVNAHPEYLEAEREYDTAQTPEEKIEKLKKMISLAPGHKGAENLRAQLKTRLKKLLEKQERGKKAGRGKKVGIKKEDLQAVILGLTNTGKSTLLSTLTNAKPKIAEHDFTTKYPVIGMTNYHGTSIQLIEIPAFGSEYYNKGLANTADAILLLIKDLNEIREIEKGLENASGKRIVVFNVFNQNKENLRKIEATLKSKKHDYVIIDTKKGKEDMGLDQLRDKLFLSFGKIRVYTKEPGKEKSKKPIILEPGSSVKRVAEKALRDFSIVKETKIWGPSSKFPGQKVGLNHELKDLDVVEFKTR